MDLSKLSLGDKVLAASGLALFIFSFFPWFGKEVIGFSVSYNAWDTGFFTGILPTLIGLLLLGYVVVTKVLDGVTLPDLPVPYALVVLGLAGLAALLVLIRLAIGLEYANISSADLDRKFGIYLAALAVLALAGGAFLKFQEEGSELPTKRGNTGPGTTGGDGGAPTPF